MPDFGDPFAGNSLGRVATPEELARMLRFAIAAEYEAVQLYEQIAECAGDFENIRKIMIDVANEEKVHAGEFLALLSEVAPDENEHYMSGIEEVQEIVNKTKQIVSRFLSK